MRPSGNADELRIYAVADTQARADASPPWASKNLREFCAGWRKPLRLKRDVLRLQGVVQHYDPGRPQFIPISSASKMRLARRLQNYGSALMPKRLPSLEFASGREPLNDLIAEEPTRFSARRRIRVSMAGCLTCSRFWTYTRCSRSRRIPRFSGRRGICARKAEGSPPRCRRQELQGR